jgi:hypothetical protein
LAFLIDGLHEDVNLVKHKPYYEDSGDSENRAIDDIAATAWQRHLARNRSVVVDLFHGLLKSSVTCLQPGCGKASVTFDPFMCLSLSLPTDSHRGVAVTFVPLQSVGSASSSSSSLLTASSVTTSRKSAQQLLNFRMPAHSRVGDLVKLVADAVGVPMDSLVTVDVYKNKVRSTCIV